MNEPAMPDDKIADDADVLHMGILDGEAEGREGERRDVDLVRRQRGDLRRAAFEMHRLVAVALAEMLRDLLLLEEDRGELRRHHRPAGADGERLGAGG